MAKTLHTRISTLIGERELLLEVAETLYSNLTETSSDNDFIVYGRLENKIRSIEKKIRKLKNKMRAATRTMIANRRNQ